MRLGLHLCRNGRLASEQEKSDISYRAVQWVYGVARDLMPFSHGIYGADLGPEPKDACLAIKAFCANGPRLAGVKLPTWRAGFACPAPDIPPIVILVTGPNRRGKDYCSSI
ncbi:hypothetical protein BJY01DRAFT_226877 [Aspergillus pseudoustus]|uniref:Uncharacterized protein n=1 Tax=Aspergillus pseudoustus TaxID=1810923 RepID=A0ABR4IVR3_9EURO